MKSKKRFKKVVEYDKEKISKLKYTFLVIILTQFATSLAFISFLYKDIIYSLIYFLSPYIALIIAFSNLLGKSTTKR